LKEQGGKWSSSGLGKVAFHPSRIYNNSKEKGMGKRSGESLLTERDIDFLIEAVHPEVIDKPKLKEIITEDEDLRSTFISDEKVFGRLMNDEEIFLKISPRLFFEILLRRVVNDFKGVSYTLEKTSTMKIPVFDTKEVVELLNKDFLVDYLAHMLSSFTKIENYTIWYKTKSGVLERIQFNDIDLLSLMGLCEVVDGEYRLGFYKRIADICLFILGIYPDYVESEYRYPLSGHVRPQFRGKARISPEEYEKEGRRFYKLAAEHQSTKELDLSETFWILHENFQKAKKPLNFIAEVYLQHKKNKLFV
jgi:hypothetical protein